MKKLIAGNWKMNGTVASTVALAKDIAGELEGATSLFKQCDFLVAPTFLHLPIIKNTFEENGVTEVSLCGQDCAKTGDGAFTGDISATMLADIGCKYVILGHSERRTLHGETSEEVAAKVSQAHEKGLIAVICVGEKESERDTGHETDVIASQLEMSLPDSCNGQNTVIAYEPVWAIGTGKAATPEDIRLMHKFIREKLTGRLEDSAEMRILYGGSVKAGNAAEIFAVPDVDGALIGGASLDARQFIDIARAAAES